MAILLNLIINSIYTPDPFLPERTSKNKTVLSKRGDFIKYITAAANPHNKIINIFSHTTFKATSILATRQAVIVTGIRKL